MWSPLSRLTSRQLLKDGASRRHRHAIDESCRLSASQCPFSSSLGSGKIPPHSFLYQCTPTCARTCRHEATASGTALVKSRPTDAETRAESSNIPRGGHERRHSSNASLGNARMGDCVVRAPRSTLKYGDRLRLWAR